MKAILTSIAKPLLRYRPPSLTRMDRLASHNLLLIRQQGSWPSQSAINCSFNQSGFGLGRAQSSLAGSVSRISGIIRHRIPASVGIAATFIHVMKPQIFGASPTRDSGGVAAVDPPGPLTKDLDHQMAEDNGPVVSVDWLHQHLNDPNLKVLDASWYMPFDKRNPLQEYKESHIPGALFFDIDGIVDTTSEMPHMLPSEAAFAAAASALGIQNQHSIIVYDGKGIFSAARVWWMFRAFGHKKVWVLDGGLPRWLGRNYPVESPASDEALAMIDAASKSVKRIYQGEQVDASHFRAELQQHLVLSLEQVKNNIQEKKYMLVDARSKARFNGSAPEPRHSVKGGHIPGSTCVPFTEVLSSNGTLLSQDDLTGKFQVAGITLDYPIAVSCGTGVTACILALALHRIGQVDVPVYDGSWTEWGLTPNVPVETNVEAS